MELKSRGADEEIEIPDHLACRTHSAALTAEEATDILIDPNHGDAAQEIIEGLLVPLRISRTINPLVEFGEGDHREGEPRFLELFQAVDDGRMPIQIVNDPIRRSRTGTIAPRSSRPRKLPAGSRA
jgi:hypothetical protein